MQLSFCAPHKSPSVILRSVSFVAQTAFGSTKALRGRFACALAVAALLCGTSLNGRAQEYRGGENARALVVQPIDGSKMVRLAGNTHPAAIAGNDRGKLEESTPMEHMQLLLQRPPELEKELVSLIDEQHRKGSPNYHKWLSAEDFGRRYGVSPQDVDKVRSWLEGQGFRVDGVLTNGMVVEFSGTAGQVNKAFHTEIHTLDVDGKAHFANMSDPQIPAALSGVVKGVHALHNFMPHPLFKKRTDFTYACPSADCSTPLTLYAVVPGDLATIYNINPLFSSGITGAGQTVVVIEDTLIQNVSDVSTFRSAFGLSGYSGTFSQVTATGSATCLNSGVNGAEGEAALDAEWAGAAAPDAAIKLASCSDTATVFGGLIALQNLINGANPPQIVSISYGECESENGNTANASYVSTYQQAASEGVSVFVASGDEGAASCDANKTVATHGIAVSGFTSTPYNVSVGGTDFGDTYESLQPEGPPVSNYWNASNTSSFASALSYMPEIPWNDSCASELIYSLEGYSQSYGSTGFCNSTEGKADYRTTASGSGGPSTYEINNKPSWQKVLGNPTDNTRDIPDVSLFASNGAWNHLLEYCLTDTSQGGVPCDYTNATDAIDLGAGGTSFASPILAGIQALVNQSQGGNPQGNPDYTYYNLANTEFGASGSASCNSSLGPGEASYCVFNDITLGDIDLNCTGVNCFGTSGTGKTATQGALSTSTSTLQIAYGSNTGWDFATGLGSINAYNLVHNWNGVITGTKVVSNANPVAQGTPVTFTATVTPTFGSGVTGTVTWSSNTGCGASTISSGAATCTTSSLPANTDTITATYSGDSNFASSQGSTQETVNAGPSTMTLPAPSSTLAGPSVTFQWTQASGSTGNALWIGSTGAGSANLYQGGVHAVTSLTVSGLPTNGETIYVRLWTSVNGTLTHNDYTYSAAAQSTMSSPAPSSTLPGASVTFMWTTGSGSGDALWLGSTGAGSHDLYEGGVHATTSVTVNGLPTNGETIYARLWTSFNGTLVSTDYQFTAAAAGAMTSPTPNSTLAGSSVTFMWTAGSGSANALWIGTTGAGSHNLLEGGLHATTSLTFSSLPINGATIYVRLYTSLNGTLLFNDYTYTAASQSTMISPAPNSTLPGASVTFTWTAGSGSGNALWLGSTGAGSHDLYEGGVHPVTSVTVNGLPTNSETIYARLWTSLNGTLTYIDYVYTAQ